MSRSSRRFFHERVWHVAMRVRCLRGPSFHRRGLVASGDYSGRAAIPARERAGLFPVSSHELCVSSVTYRSALPLTGEPECGRSGTFTGQCCQPFCPGDPASHVDGPPSEPSYRSLRRMIDPPGLQAARDPGPPSPPKRDASRTVSTWPLRHRSLPRDAGCIPRRGRVRVKISERVWSRPGRIRLHRTPFDKTAPFTTEPTTPAAHTKHEAQASVYVTSRHTRLRIVLVFSSIHAKVALSN